MDHVCTLCQVIGMARYHEKAVATTKDAATACGMGGVSLGFYPTPEDVADGSRNAGVWAGTIEATRKIVEDRTCFKTGQFEAVGIAPLKLMPVEPDVVQVWGSPVQMLSLVYAQIWDGGNPVELKTNGHGASCNDAPPTRQNRSRTFARRSLQRGCGKNYSCSRNSLTAWLNSSGCSRLGR
jgi:uncharacterized protein (DUF169 family)